MYKKLQKVGSLRNTIISKRTGNFDFNFDTKSLLLVAKLYWNFQFVSCILSDKYSVGEHYCRAGPGQFFTVIKYVVKK